jgi:hypothetical protein
MSKKKLLEELSKLKMNLKSADPKGKRFTNQSNKYTKARIINADINLKKEELAKHGHAEENSNYESDYGDNNGNNNNSTDNDEENRGSPANRAFIRNHESPSRRRKAPKKTYRFKALNRYKAKPKTRRHRR